MGEERCEVCRFFLVGKDYDVCRRYAPRPSPSALLAWPAASAKNWCGEWKAQELTQGQSAQ